MTRDQTIEHLLLQAQQMIREGRDREAVALLLPAGMVCPIRLEAT